MKKFLSQLKLSKEYWQEVIKYVTVTGVGTILLYALTWFIFHPQIIALIVCIVAIIIFGIVIYQNILHGYRIPLGRESEIRQLVSQIQTGQSSAIIGEFGTERKNILDYLLNEETELFGSQADNLVFSLIDISALPKKCHPSLFWKTALMPLQEEIANQSHLAPLAQAFKTCQNNNFETQYVEKLFALMRVHELRLVLMLHRFEVLLHRPLLNREDFLGGLRSLASSSNPSSLSLIISMKKSIKQFHEDIKHITAGSPYLNFLGTITLGALSGPDIEELFNQSKHPFDEKDRCFIKDLSGGHPYLLQIAAACLLEAKKDQKKANDSFSEKTEELWMNILQAWDDNTCKAFMLIAQGYDGADFRNELKELEKQGFVFNENEQWRVGSSVFAGFVADKTVQELCQSKSSDINS